MLWVLNETVLLSTQNIYVKNDGLENIYICMLKKIVYLNLWSRPYLVHGLELSYETSQVDASLGNNESHYKFLGHIAQSVTCLTTDACLTADLGYTS